MILVTAEEMRAADRRTIEEIGLPGIVLMENAAQGAVRALLEQTGPVEGLSVAGFCGRGNNGGDGLAMLRILAGRGADCTAYLFCRVEDMTGDAALNLRAAANCGVIVAEVPEEDDLDRLLPSMAGHDIYLDALLGTGLNSEVRGRYLRAIEFLNQLASPVMSVDIPSGLSADTGHALGLAVEADWTATFGLVKQGLALDGKEHAGEIFLVDIGIPPLVSEDLEIDTHLLEEDLVFLLLPPRPAGSHKGDFGHLLVVGGSTGKSGAPCLAAMGGIRAGAGLVTVGLPAGLNQVAEVKLISAMSQPLPEEAHGGLSRAGLDTILELMESREVLALGPGLGTAEETVDLVRGLVTRLDKPMVLDADGLNALAGFAVRPASEQVVFTPHPGEAARLLGLTTAQVQADRLGAARRIARNWGVVCVLKGARSVVAEPGGRAWINPTGGVLLASGGSGDVLTGVIGGLMAQGAGALEAACAGVYVHGLAAQLAEEHHGLRGMAAEELADFLVQAFRLLEGEREEEE